VKSSKSSASDPVRFARRRFDADRLGAPVCTLGGRDQTLSSVAPSREGLPELHAARPRVASSSAHLSNVIATERLLGAVPFGGELRALLIEPLLFQHWDDATERAFWLASDGTEVRCVIITGLGALQMADLWVKFNDRISRAQFNISPQLVREIIEARMRVAVELVN
jgi:hypothetical protein